MPRLCNSRESICASLSAICPISSSVPMATISAITSRLPEPNGFCQTYSHIEYSVITAAASVSSPETTLSYKVWSQRQRP